jgi:hypothetical protein
LLKDGEELFGKFDKFEGYVFFVDIDMLLLDGVVFLFVDDMFVVVDMFVLDVVL